MSREHREDNSKLVTHAARELTEAGAFEKDTMYGGMLGKSVMKLVRAFAADGHSGNSAAMTLMLFDRVIRFKALTPLTDNPAEWTKLGPDMFPEATWQSTRQPSCFSKDGGKTYYDIDEKPKAGKEQKMHESKTHKKS